MAFTLPLQHLIATAFADYIFSIAGVTGSAIDPDMPTGLLLKDCAPGLPLLGQDPPGTLRVAAWNYGNTDYEFAGNDAADFSADCDVAISCYVGTTNNSSMITPLVQAQFLNEVIFSRMSQGIMQQVVADGYKKRLVATEDVKFKGSSVLPSIQGQAILTFDGYFNQSWVVRVSISSTA